jgi:serine/threonine protein kinase
MSTDALIGKQLGGYVIRAPLGEGGMARVYKAYQASLQREVAIKIILSPGAEASDFRLRFQREAQLIAHLEHPNIVAVYDFGEVDELMYLVMQCVSGGTLRERLDAAPLEPRLATQYAIQMARALHHAHQRGIVHRDVKPQNMLISSSDPNHLLLSDFGIAKLFSADDPLPTRLASSTAPTASQVILTSTGQMAGTPAYMAPEQITQQLVDARTDVYALGVVLYHMLAGHPPFQAPNLPALLYQQLYVTANPLSTYRPAVSEALTQIVAKAMAKAPGARFPTAVAMADALEATLVTPSISTGLPPLNPPAPASPSPTQQSQSTSVSALSYPGSQPLPASPPVQFSSGSLPVYGPVALGTMPQRASAVGPSVPALPVQPGRRRWLASLISAVLVVLVLSYTGYTVLHNNKTQGPPSLPFSSSSAQATAFVETFQDNQRNWSSPTNDVTVTLANQQLVLATGNVPANNFYFPYPQAVGTLPPNFTLSAQITHNQGSSSAWYGLAFALDQSGGTFHSYAFAVNDNGQYAFLKFDPTAKVIPTVLHIGQLSSQVQLAANQPNRLQVVVYHQTFSFSVNGTTIPIGGSAVTADSSAPYTGGQLGLLVTGTNSIFIVTKVQLTIP